MDFLKNTKTTEYSVISICTILLFPLHSTDFTGRNDAGNTAAYAVKERLREQRQEQGWLDRHLLWPDEACGRGRRQLDFNGQGLIPLLPFLLAEAGVSGSGLGVAGN
jgi:hypothetical protein